MFYKYIFLLLVCVGVQNTCWSQQYDSMVFDKLQRYYLVHLPANYDSGKAYPLVIAMHGGFGSGSQLEKQSDLSQTADSKGFIVVYPDGVKSPIGIRTWNADGCCGYANETKVDDVGFIDSLVNLMHDRFKIEPGKRFATGMSNGGYMAYRIACEKPDLFAAIAPVACGMTAKCEPKKWVPTIHFHSYNDTNVPYQGGYGKGVSNHYTPPLDSIRSVWAKSSNCMERDSALIKGQYDLLRYKNCDCEAEYILYISYDGGHSWPGGKKTIIGDPPSEVMYANNWMWDFFEKHPKCEMIPGSISTLSHDNLEVYPNPGNNRLTITYPTKINSIIILDSKGSQVKKLEMDCFEHSTELDISNLNIGFYHLLLQTELGYLNYNFIKIP